MRAHLHAIPALGLLLLSSTSFAGSFTYSENFDQADFPNWSNYRDADHPDANLQLDWSFYPGQGDPGDGRSRIYDWGSSRGGVLVLDDSSYDNDKSLAEAILTLDFTGMTLSSLNLNFEHYDSYDEEDYLVSSSRWNSTPDPNDPNDPTNSNNPNSWDLGDGAFTNHRNKDGVAVSSGATDSQGRTIWFPLLNFDQDDRTWEDYAADIFALVTAVDDSNLLNLTGQFFIKFQQYDNLPHGGDVHSDGRKFDNILVQGNMTVNSDPSSPVPEPATATLFGIGIILLAGYRRRRCRQ